MLQKNLFKIVTIAKQHNGFFIYSELYTKGICKIAVAR